MGEAASKMRASSSSRVSTLLLYTSLVQSHKQKFKGVRPGDSNTPLDYHSELDIFSHIFSHNDRQYHLPKYLTLSWITLYKKDDLIRSKHVALLYTTLIVFIIIPLCRAAISVIRVFIVYANSDMSATKTTNILLHRQTILSPSFSSKI
jgi:hypothetical protein